MEHQGKVKAYTQALWKSGWIFLAAFIAYCVWFVGYNHPCESYAITLPLILVLIILTPILLKVNEKFVIIGINFGAISGALTTLSGYFSVYQYELIYDELAINVAMSLFMGLMIGAVVGAIGGVIVWWVYLMLKRFPYLQKIWVVIVVLLLLSTLPWLYRTSWGAFGHRGIINELVAKHGDDLFEALKKYDNNRSDFAYNSMHVFSYIDDRVEVWIAERQKLVTEEPIWIVVYELQLQDGIWEVSGVPGVCVGNYNCSECNKYRDAYVFDN